MFSLGCAESQAGPIVSCGFAVAAEGRVKYENPRVWHNWLRTWYRCKGGLKVRRCHPELGRKPCKSLYRQFISVHFWYKCRLYMAIFKYRVAFLCILWGLCGRRYDLKATFRSLWRTKDQFMLPRPAGYIWATSTSLTIYKKNLHIFRLPSATGSLGIRGVFRQLLVSFSPLLYSLDSPSSCYLPVAAWIR